MSTGSAREYLARFGHDEHEPMPRHLTPEAYLGYREKDHEWRRDMAFGILEALRIYHWTRRTPPDTGLIRRWMAEYGAGDSEDAECWNVMGHLIRGRIPQSAPNWSFCEWAASEAWGDVKAWWLEYGDRADYYLWLREQGVE